MSPEEAYAHLAEEARTIARWSWREPHPAYCTCSECFTPDYDRED